MNAPIAIHVLTGFLGSGKTTLLNTILKSDTFQNSAVIINEFGEIGLDHHLVESADDTIIELSNGCLCCTVRGQLIDTLEDLLARKPNRILIETTGLADPVPVLQALIASPNINDAVELQGLYTVVDAANGLGVLEKHSEAKRQVSLADLLILSKTDQLKTLQQKPIPAALSRRLETLNPSAEIISKEDFLKNLSIRFKTSFPIRNMAPANHGHDHTHNINHHNERISTKQLYHSTPISKVQLDMFLDLLLSAHGDHILRIKGLANIEGENKPLVIQGVGRTLSEPYFLKQWPDQNRHTNLTVFVDGINGDYVERLFNGFMDRPSIDTPDKAALTENPLAIPGFSLKK